MVLVCSHMRRIPRALGCRAYISVWWEGALCVARLAVFHHPPLHSPLLWGVGAHVWLSGFASHRCSLHLGAQLAANSRSPRMSQAPNLQIGTQFLKEKKISYANPHRSHVGSSSPHLGVLLVLNHPLSCSPIPESVWICTGPLWS